VTSRSAFGKNLTPHAVATAAPGGVRLSKATSVVCALFYVALLAWGAGAAWFILCRDDLVARVLSRQAEVQYAYEERLSALRSQLDRVASRQLVNQDSFEDRVDRLISRQSQIETRHAVVSSLMQTAGIATPGLATSSGANSRIDPAKSDKMHGIGGPAVLAPQPPARPELVSPAARPSERASDKPQPDTFSTSPDDQPALRGSSEAPATKAALQDSRDAVGPRIASAEHSLLNVERAQVRALEHIASDIGRSVERMKLAVSETGLDPQRFMRALPTAGTGGPYVPADGAGASLFDKLAVSVRMSLDASARLRQTVISLPLARPLPETSDVTSSFGYRLDPFLRSPAMHTGIDFRGETGTSVRATGAGIVVTAEPSGGYGNMIEIAHAGGVTSRYAHLSAILVNEGQKITAGELVGRVGSTGRSTAPHLHYETRIDGDPVDPTRFLRAGTRLKSTRN
jgi:murein DD-endopeptidase MepM/ murein hydrolase activator NlpD